MRSSAIGKYSLGDTPAVEDTCSLGSPPTPVSYTGTAWCTVSSAADADAIIGAGGATPPDPSQYFSWLSGIPLVGSTLSSAVTNLITWGVQLQTLGGCDNPSLSSLYTARGLIGVFEHWLGTPLTEARRTLEYDINYLCQTKIPEYFDAIQLYLQNEVSQELMVTWGKAHGYCDWTTNAIADSRRRRPDTLELIRLLQRGEITQESFNIRMRANGYLDEVDVNLLNQFANELPSPSDLVRFAVRHVFEPSLALRFGFSDELNPQFVAWHSQLGFGYDVQLTDPIDGNAYTINWAIAQWWSHWVWPSPTQAVDAMFRFRPGRDKRAEDPLTASIDVPEETVDLLLRGNDYPPQFRAIIKGLGTSLLGIRHIRLGIAQGVLDRQRVFENFKKQRYSDADAEALTEMNFRTVAEAKQRRILQESGSAIEKGFDLGSISEQDYRQYLSYLGLKSDEIDITVQLANVRIQEGRVRRAVANVRRGYLKGQYSDDQVRFILGQFSVDGQRIEDYIKEWFLFQQSKTKELAASQLIKYATQGLIDTPEVARRLLNMGYPPADVEIQIAEIVVLVADRLAKNLAQQERQAKQNARELERIAREQQKAADQLKRRMGGQATVAMLKAWLVEGLVGVDLVEGALTERNWNPVEIAAFIADAELAAEKKLSKGNGKPKPQSGS